MNEYKYDIEVINGEHYFILEKYPDTKFCFKNIRTNDDHSKDDDDAYIYFDLDILEKDPKGKNPIEDREFLSTVEDFLHYLLDMILKNAKRIENMKNEILNADDKNEFTYDYIRAIDGFEK